MLGVPRQAGLWSADIIFAGSSKHDVAAEPNPTWKSETLLAAGMEGRVATATLNSPNDSSRSTQIKSQIRKRKLHSNIC